MKKVVDDTAYCGLKLTRIYNVLGKKYKRKMITDFTEFSNMCIYDDIIFVHFVESCNCVDGRNSRLVSKRRSI